MIALARILAGLTLWALGFMLLYALHGLGCAQGWAAFRTIQVTVWVMLMIAGALLLGWLMRTRCGMLDWVAVAGATVGLVATFWTGFPVAALSICL